MKIITQKPIFDIFSSRKKDKKDSSANNFSSGKGGRIELGGGRGSEALVGGANDFGASVLARITD